MMPKTVGFTPARAKIKRRPKTYHAHAPFVKHSRQKRLKNLKAPRKTARPPETFTRPLPVDGRRFYVIVVESPQDRARGESSENDRFFNPVGGNCFAFQSPANPLQRAAGLYLLENIST